MDSKSKSGSKRSRVLAPANLEPPVIQSEALEGGDLVEGKGGGWVNEGNELYGQLGGGFRKKPKTRTAICLSCIYLML